MLLLISLEKKQIPDELKTLIERYNVTKKKVQMKQFKSKIQLNLETKIIVFISLIVVVIITLYCFIFTAHYKHQAEDVIGTESINTLSSIDTSLTKVIDSANNCSKIILSDDMIQVQMESGDILSDIGMQQAIRKKVYSILQIENAVENVWFIDDKGQKLTVGDDALLIEAQEQVDNDFSGLKRKYGTAEIIYFASGNHTELSLVRSFNSLSSFKPLGVIGVDIKDGEIRKIVENSFELGKERLIILDAHNSPIFYGGDILEKQYLDDIIAKLDDNKDGFFEQSTYKGNSYYISGIVNQYDRWKIIRATPYFTDEQTQENIRFNILLYTSLGLVILLSAFLASGFLTKPIATLTNAMRGVEEGRLEKIETVPKIKELRDLFSGFNHMVSRIEALIAQTIDRQRRIRQVELNEMQELMKPHFLYNTLDSVEALALMGDTDGVCNLIDALGDFYRKSVSGGREFLTIGEEIRIVKDYIQIMEIRFGDSFNTKIVCEAACMEYMIPKLTIQPLVENAFQHGVRAKNNHGDIYINVSFEGENIHISVEDSGDGVPKEIIDEIANDKEPVLGKSLGLRGTIERLRLMYGEAFRYAIEKKPSRIELFINVGNLLDKGNV